MVALSNRCFSCYLASRVFFLKGSDICILRTNSPSFCVNQLSIYSLCPFALLFEKLYVHGGRKMPEAQMERNAQLSPPPQQNLLSCVSKGGASGQPESSVMCRQLEGMVALFSGLLVKLFYLPFLGNSPGIPHTGMAGIGVRRWLFCFPSLWQ